MALDSEIERIRKDAVRWRSLAQQLLRYADQDALTDWELDFLEGIQSREWLDELSYRQCEILLEIRDDVEIVSSVRNYSVKYLLRACFENRFDLDEQEEAWLVALHECGPGAVRRKNAWRLLALARRLGEVEGEWAA